MNYLEDVLRSQLSVLQGITPIEAYSELTGKPEVREWAAKTLILLQEIVEARFAQDDAKVAEAKAHFDAMYLGAKAFANAATISLEHIGRPILEATVVIIQAMQGYPRKPNDDTFVSFLEELGDGTARLAFDLMGEYTRLLVN